MGYNKAVAKLALKNCNNVISDSIQYIQENPGIAGPSSSKSMEMLALIEDLIPEVSSVKFVMLYFTFSWF